MSAVLAAGYQAPVAATLIFSLAAVVLTMFVIGRPASMRKTGLVILPLVLLAILVEITDSHGIFVLATLLAAAGEALIVQERVTAYVTGLGLFLATRVVYAASFVISAMPALLTDGPWRLVVVAAAVLVIAYALKRFWLHAGPLKGAILIYAALIVAMTLLAATVPPPAVLIGTALLVGSDLGLAADRFLVPSDETEPLWAARATFLARYAGQALIVLAAVGLV